MAFDVAIAFILMVRGVPLPYHSSMHARSLQYLICVHLSVHPGLHHVLGEPQLHFSAL
jgi:hypothetical protein